MYTQLGSSQKLKKNYTLKFFSFIAGVVDTAEQHPFAIIYANFRKKSKRSQWHTQGPGGHWFTKKTWGRKSRVRLPLRKNPDYSVYTNMSCSDRNIYKKLCGFTRAFLYRKRPLQQNGEMRKSNGKEDYICGVQTVARPPPISPSPIQMW